MTEKEQDNEEVALHTINKGYHLWLVGSQCNILASAVVPPYIGIRIGGQQDASNIHSSHARCKM